MIIGFISTILTLPEMCNTVTTLKEKYTPYSIESYVLQLSSDSQLFECFDKENLTNYIWGLYSLTYQKEVLKLGFEVNNKLTQMDLKLMTDSKLTHKVIDSSNLSISSHEYKIYDEEMNNVSKLPMNVGDTKKIRYFREEAEKDNELSFNLTLDNLDNIVNDVVLAYSSNTNVIKTVNGNVMAINKGKASLYLYTGDYVNKIKVIVK